MQNPIEQKDTTNDYIQLAQIEAQEKYKEKTAKDVWEKYKEQFKSGNFRDELITIKDIKTDQDISVNIKPALMALKSLPTDQWKEFLKLAFENKDLNEKLSTEAKNKLIAEMVHLETPHTPDSYLLRSNSFARLLYMYDNPKLDETTKNKFLSYDPSCIVGASKLITDRHLQLLMERGVNEKDIAAVAFFNTVGASFGTFAITHAATLSRESKEYIALVTLTNIFKGDAKITKTPQELINEKFDALTQMNQKIKNLA
jgi:hypothetical protein